MATIKSYTDIEQSKKLAELLPLDSADMYYKYALPKSDKIIHTPEIGNPIDSLKWYNEGYTFRGKREPITLSEYCIPCWSLSVLLYVLPEGYSVGLTKSFNGIDYYCNLDGKDISVYADNPVDACVAMIEKLHELNLL